MLILQLNLIKFALAMHCLIGVWFAKRVRAETQQKQADLLEFNDHHSKLINVSGTVKQEFMLGKVKVQKLKLRAFIILNHVSFFTLLKFSWKTALKCFLIFRILFFF